MDGLGAVILAAGMSSRMREFKPMLKLGNRTIISHVVSLMQLVGARPIVVVTGNNADIIEAHLANENVIFARNERFAETQMLDSLLLGLGALPPNCRRVLIIPADIPLVRPETVKRLLETDGDFVRPVCDGKNGHPALLSFELVPVLRDYTGDNGLRGAIKTAGVKVVNVETNDRGVLLDADTPEDYDAMCRYFEKEFKTL